MTLVPTPTRDTVNTATETAAANALRSLAIDMIERANSGHPGLPLGAAPMASVLWRHVLKFDAADPTWPDRDRFVLSAGHGSSLLYGLLHLTGFGLELDDLKAFRQWDSLTPGHPEFGHTAGVECTTGPLGQGVANAIGMAVAERALAHRYNTAEHTVVDHQTFALCGDGDLMEGVAQEAISLAGKLGLGKLVLLYDSNDITLDGPMDLSHNEDTQRRFEAAGWHVIRVEDGDTDYAALLAAIEAGKAETARPTLIEVKTTIGYGSPNKAGTSSSHGAPLGADELTATKANLGIAGGPFEVPDDVLAAWREAGGRGTCARGEWEARFESWSAANPELAREWRHMLAGELPPGWDRDLPEFPAGEKPATRVSGHESLQAFARNLEVLFGIDADLSCSTKAFIKGAADFDAQTGAGRNLRAGIREHAMASMAAGISYHGGLIPFTSTFFVFADYMRPAIRLAAMNRLGSIFVFTHDSVAVGEDGPTHQPVEQLASLRAIPGLTVVRPGDASEAREAWRQAIARRNGPTALVLSRQGMETLSRTGSSGIAPAEELARGGYVLADADEKLGPGAIVIATGSELGIALEARERLQAEGIGVRVVSMPSWELFAEQPAAWREAVLPAAVTARVSVEAGATFGWERWTGGAGINLGIDRFGASAPGGLVLERLGMTADAIETAVRKLVEG
ncbi:MAG: transketolase [Planctomycetota bacterium]|nr:transketolase [Planctomycetota bacterium]